MWFLSIIIDLALTAIGIAICFSLYKKHYSSMGALSLNVIHSFNALQGNIFAVGPNYSPVYCNLILKCVLTIVCNLIVHFTDKMWISYIYLLFVVLSFFVMKRRKDVVQTLDESQKMFIMPVYKVYRLIPIFHVLYFITLYVTYYFNV